MDCRLSQGEDRGPARVGRLAGNKPERLMGTKQLGLQVKDVLTATAIAYFSNHFLGGGEV